MNLSGRDTIAIFGQGPVGWPHAIRQGDGRAGDRARHQPAAAGARQEFGADELVDPAPTIRSRRSRT
jgi:hypothetical protein